MSESDASVKIRLGFKELRELSRNRRDDFLNNMPRLMNEVDDYIEKELKKIEGRNQDKI